MRKKALLLDFDDSFTFNLLQELEGTGLIVETANWRDFVELPDVDLLVLGPGPGHPDDYQVIFPLLNEWLGRGGALFGVCLGHQIFWRLQGAQVRRSSIPVHGQRIWLELPPTWEFWFGHGSRTEVQRYNSLCVPREEESRRPDLTCLTQANEVMITRGERLLTYQFHPESVGTSYPNVWVGKIIEVLV